MGERKHLKHQIGLVGTGRWGANIAKAFEETGRVHLRWLCDTNEEALRQISGQRPHSHATTSFEQVLNDPLVEAVAISTPTTTHYELACSALAAGKHVFLEKPLTILSADAIDLIRRSKASGLILMVGHVFEYNSAIIEVKRMIETGELGEIIYMNFERTNLGPVRTDVNVLWDLAAHDISIMCAFLEVAPINVTASGLCHLNPGIEDVAFATFSFANGTRAHMHVSWLNPRKIRQITVVGSKRMLIWDDLDVKAPIRLFDKGAGPNTLGEESSGFLSQEIQLFDNGISIPSVEINQPLQAECTHFIDCLENNSTPRSDGEGGLRVVRILEATMDSLLMGGTLTPVFT